MIENDKVKQVKARCACGKFYRRDRNYNYSICPWCLSEAGGEGGVQIPVFFGQRAGRYCRECGAQFDAKGNRSSLCPDCAVKAEGQLRFDMQLPTDARRIADQYVVDDGLEFA